MFFSSYRSLLFVRDLILLMISLSLSLSATAAIAGTFVSSFSIVSHCSFSLSSTFFPPPPVYSDEMDDGWTVAKCRGNVFSHCIKTDSTSRFSSLEYVFIARQKVPFAATDVLRLSLPHVLSLVECK